MDKINEIRNRFSHRKRHSLDASMIEALKEKVDLVVPAAPVLKCEVFSLWTSGKDQHGNRAQMTHEWRGADTRIRFLIVFMAFMLKFTHWIQDAFNVRGINYEIAAVPAQGPK